jgi:CMP-N,N'-diacetyllegionaminic acid synthase
MKDSAALGIIVARGGSSGLPRKNVLPLAGRPLVVHTIEAALGCRGLSRTILSTEDPEILAIGQTAGCPAPFVRPSTLAGDRSSTVDVALHALDWLAVHEQFTPDIVVLLPATAPLRRTEHIEDALRILLADRTADAVVAVTETEYPPYWMLTIADDRLGWLFPEQAKANHRQELPPAYRPNGSIYAIRQDVLRRERTFYPKATAPYIMPGAASVNIDSELDLIRAEILAGRRG